ncbi:alpha/beta hydrolase fold protein [Halobacterium hubeiense]|uniref:Alpha/beta hydrolase fold protein n=1 Tax=Halobacterium hubeiense TaxID=1407499 RepID=A0A0U5H2X6_9EURY|nr:dienelactone hydrolase family protein [Halobacterium hubeiense]CQH58371.1 alpha/beta hydrolase fold protein [Halobacterium hubeiense]
MTDADPHAGQPVESRGPALEDADSAVILLHGRGARAQGMLGFADDLPSEGTAFVAPQAARATWYPNSFLEPTEENEPWFNSALGLVNDVFEDVTEHVPAERVALLGFSQGACLGSEFLARNPREYGGFVAFSGGLHGPEGTTYDYDGDLDGTPVFLGCSDRDPHIPEERVHETRDAFEAMDADVTERIYEGMGHTVNQDELEHAADIVGGL